MDAWGQARNPRLEPLSSVAHERVAGALPADLAREASTSLPSGTSRPSGSLIRRAILAAVLACVIGLVALYLISLPTRFAKQSGDRSIAEEPATSAPGATGSPVGDNDGPGQQATSQRSSVLPSAFTVRPGRVFPIPLRVSASSGHARLVGSFSVAGGHANDVEAFVTDRSGLSSLTNGNSFTSIYASGRVTSGNIDLALPPGSYYLVFSNVFSLISPKAISTSMELRY